MIDRRHAHTVAHCRGEEAGREQRDERKEVPSAISAHMLGERATTETQLRLKNFQQRITTGAASAN